MYEESIHYKCQPEKFRSNQFHNRIEWPKPRKITSLDAVSSCRRVKYSHWFGSNIIVLFSADDRRDLWDRLSDECVGCDTRSILNRKYCFKLRKENEYLDFWTPTSNEMSSLFFRLTFGGFTTTFSSFFTVFGGGRPLSFFGLVSPNRPRRSAIKINCFSSSRVIVRRCISDRKQPILFKFKHLFWYWQTSGISTVSNRSVFGIYGIQKLY